MRALSQADRDRFYAEAAPAARLYGAIGAPVSEAILAQQRQAMRPKLEQSQIIFDVLGIMRRAPAQAGLRPTAIDAADTTEAGVEVLCYDCDITPSAVVIARLGPWPAPAPGKP